MLVGCHVEGYDHLILKALLAKLLGLPEASIELDRVEAGGMGWHHVLETLPKALLRFYGKCCAMVVVGVDNDGNAVVRNGIAEDPAHARHWLHAGTRLGTCRQCQLELIVERTRPSLTWIAGKPGGNWPIVVFVPVEMIESWLLAATAITQPGRGSLNAENEARAGQKWQLYGRPEATRDDVERVGVALIRSLSDDQLQRLRSHARSFDGFASQVKTLDKASLAKACWS